MGPGTVVGQIGLSVLLTLDNSCPSLPQSANGEDYSGGRELSDFTQFLADRTGVKAKGSHDEL